jgi:hypothetical protein
MSCSLCDQGVPVVMSMHVPVVTRKQNKTHTKKRVDKKFIKKYGYVAGEFKTLVIPGSLSRFLTGKEGSK